MRFSCRAFGFASLSIGLLLGSQSAAVEFPNVAFDQGETFNISGAIEATGTTGARMAGAEVTAFFASGGQETLTWVATGVHSGGVIGSGWSLDVPFDTFGALWTLQADVGLSRVLIDLVPGTAVWDVWDLGDDERPKAPGTLAGRPISGVTGLGQVELLATYRNEASVNGVFYGHLYGLLDLEFTNPADPDLGFLGTLTFVSDTDHATPESIFEVRDPDPGVIPEPVTAALAGLSLLGAGLAATRRRRA